MTSEHISAFQKNTEGLIANWELLLMNRTIEERTERSSQVR